MGILTVIMVACVNLVCVGIDILRYFLIVRVVLTRWDIRWLKPFDSTGSKLVDGFNECVKRGWRQVTANTLMPQGCLAVGLIGLSVVRFMVVAIMGVF